MIKYSSYSDIGGRSCNEDSVRIKDIGSGICVVVADGLGGHGGGDVASKEAVEVICGGWNGEATPDVLSNLILEAHRRILGLQTQACQMKSTAVVLAIENGRIDYAHVGDSRLYHFVDGKLVFQTKDHSASQIAVMLGQITPDQIRFHEDRSRIFRALGQEGDLAVDAAEELLAPGRHAFLLCSDGFWEYVYENEMESTLSDSASPEEWIRKMRKIHKSRIPQDNDNNTAAAVWLTV